VSEPATLLREKVERYVQDLIGPHEVSDKGVVRFRWGSTQVYVASLAWGADESIAFISIPVLYSLEPSPELFRHVALHADDWHFGHLSVTEEDGGKLKLWLTHSLLGDYLDVEELKTAVATMARTADGLDDELKAKFGGERHYED
jgi:hypothetical protein